MTDTNTPARKRIWSPIPARPLLAPQGTQKGLPALPDISAPETITKPVEAILVASSAEEPAAHKSVVPAMPDRLPASRRTSIPPRPAFHVSKLQEPTQVVAEVSDTTDKDVLEPQPVITETLGRTVYTSTADGRSKIPRLNARDKVIAQALAEHGFLTRSHIALRVGSTVDSIRKRLDEVLVKEGVLARTDTALAEPVYFLTERGADFASSAVPIWVEGDPLADGYTHKLNVSGIAIRLSAGVEPSILFDGAVAGGTPLAVIPASTINEAAAVVRNGDSLLQQKLVDVETILDLPKYPARHRGWDPATEPLSAREAAALRSFWTDGIELQGKDRALLPAYLFSGFDKYGNPEPLLDFGIAMPHMQTPDAQDNWETVFGNYGVRVELKRESNEYYKVLLLKLWRIGLYRIVFFHHANTVRESIRRIWKELIASGAVEDTERSRNFLIFRTYVPVNYDKFETRSEDDETPYFVDDRRLSEISYSYLAG